MTMQMKYIAFDSDSIDVDFSFTTGQVEKVEQLWEQGESLKEISRQIRRKPLEVTLLIMDRAELKKIKPRKNGIFGG